MPAPGENQPLLSQRFLQKILEHVAHPVFVKDRDFRMVFVNRALCDMTGFSREQLLGKTDHDLFPREQADFFRQKDTEMFERASVINIAEEPITDATGHTHVLSTTKVPLRNAEGQITHLVGIIHDISHLKQTEESLRHANSELGDAMRKLRDNNERLRELDRLKSEFLANVSHEFRTPLTLNLAPLEEMLAEPRGDVDHGRLLLIHRNTLRLLNLVNNLLSFARLESGGAEPTFTPIDVVSFTRQIASVFESALVRKGLSYRFEDRVGGPLVAYLEAEIWERMVVNLLQNALNYTPQGGITVSISRDAGREAGAFEVSVADTGIGIPENELTQIFERFHRVRRGKRPREGTGIGLALVAEGARLHGGTVTAESRPEEGARFTLHIPLGSAHLPREQVREEINININTDNDATLRPIGIRHSSGTYLSPVHSTAPVLLQNDAEGLVPGKGDAPLILVIDDNPDMRGYLRELLSSLGRVVLLADGEEGLEAARRLRPRLVLADVMLGGGMDGFELCQRIKADPLTADLPVVLLTARADISELARGLSGGADDYVLKPFNPTELRARVRLQLTLCQARAELRDHAQDLEQRLDEKVGELRRQHAELETLLKSLGEGVLVFDCRGRLTLCNDAAQALTGVGADPPIDAWAWADAVRLRTPDGKAVSPTALPACMALSGQAARDVELVLKNAQTGREAFVVMSAAPLPGSQTAGAVCTVHDVSRLKESERLKDEFLSVASHELRTPLGSLQLAVGLMRLFVRDNPSAAALLPHLERQQRQIGRLNRLINDILDMSRLQHDKLVVQVRPVELAPLLRDAVERARGTVGTHHVISLSLGALLRDTRVLADPDRLDQVLGNLLANACKYAPAGSEIVVSEAMSGNAGAGTGVDAGSGACGGAWAEVAVTDAGPGIPDELHERIFERFFQIEAAAGRSFGGLGLGLYISRELVSAQGGRLWVHSRPGEGSSFRLTLPLCEERPENSQKNHGAKDDEKKPSC